MYFIPLRKPTVILRSEENEFVVEVGDVVVDSAALGGDVVVALAT